MTMNTRAFCKEQILDAGFWMLDKRHPLRFFIQHRSLKNPASLQTQ
jgi:hypothetical protein